MKLNVRYTQISRKGHISDTGIREIGAYISSQRLDSEQWAAVANPSGRKFLPALPTSWEWVWMTSDGEFKGSFPRRVSRFYYAQHNIKVPSWFLSEIGNIARRHASDEYVYTFEFVDEFNWYAGDFGDGDSCYWGSNAGALEMLRDNGSLAVLFYDSDGAGFARAWLVEINPQVKVIFNGYGFRSHSTLTIVQVLARFFAVSYKHIRLNNWGTGAGVLFINGAAGYVLGKPSIIASIESHDFRWENVLMYTCYNCDATIDEYDVFHGPDDQDYCSDCYSDQFSSCDECGGDYYNEEVQYINGRDLCDYCREHLHSECEACERLINHRRETVIRHKGRVLCEECYARLRAHKKQK
jgi:hypothetical protein